MDECTRCGLHKFRRQRVVGRGQFPADVLLIGEAPGRSEELIGEAFTGPSGRVLNQGLREAYALSKVGCSYYVTNVVQCRPTDKKHGPNRPPTVQEAWLCMPNLEYVYRTVQPTQVVFLGREAERHCKKLWPGTPVLQHPAYLLRRGGSGCPEYRTFVIGLAEILKEVDSELHD